MITSKKLAELMEPFDPNATNWTWGYDGPNLRSFQAQVFTERDNSCDGFALHCKCREMPGGRVWWQAQQLLFGDNREVGDDVPMLRRNKDRHG